MTTTEAVPDSDVDRTKVNAASDCDATRTANFTTRPMTGDEYIESLRDDREIWFQRDRVKDSPRIRRSGT
ncbi:hypothetical protein AZG88_41030 [Rhodococcus sp. LB1]|nr:hypothetical protein AZG88_41030 [Rhodococcus sp. LB1]